MVELQDTHCAYVAMLALWGLQMGLFKSLERFCRHSHLPGKILRANFFASRCRNAFALCHFAHFEIVSGYTKSVDCKNDSTFY